MLLVVAEDERQANRTMTSDDLKKEQRRMSRRASRTQALSKKLSSSKIPSEASRGGNTTAAESSRSRGTARATKLLVVAMTLRALSKPKATLGSTHSENDGI